MTAEVSAAIVQLQQAKSAVKAPLGQQAIQFAIDLLSGAPKAKIKASDQDNQNQGPFDIFGNSYSFSEVVTGNVDIEATKQ